MRHDLDGASDDSLAQEMGPERKAIQTVNLHQSPESFFAEQLAQPANQRPTIICLDARATDIKEIIAWLKEFDGIDDAQTEDPFSPQRVVIIVSNDQQTILSIEFADRSDVDWVEAGAGDARDVPSIYQDAVTSSLKELMSTPPDFGLSQEENPEAVPIESLLPEDEKEEWRQLIKRYEEREDQA